jgi:hypothetical protein
LEKDGLDDVHARPRDLRQIRREQNAPGLNSPEGTN